jgi:hypothetical protein
MIIQSIKFLTAGRLSFKLLDYSGHKIVVIWGIIFESVEAPLFVGVSN